MANRIMLNQTSYHGAGAIAEIVTEAKAHAFQKALVCSDPDLIKFGVTGKVTGLLDKEGLAYEIYSDIKANPTIDNVKNGVAAFKASGADYIIAIGGGSSMDTSKAIGIIIANPEFEDVRSLEGVAPTKKPCVPIIAVPTTAGTAAEVTINYVITGCWNSSQLKGYRKAGGYSFPCSVCIWRCMPSGQSKRDKRKGYHQAVRVIDLGFI